ncbi:HTH domain-containing protein [Oribacterium sinus]|uniref:HTH domain-containing protein n=1 Tax=Oribacterium sinus TaxID=237576 RepID=UPI0028D2D886|nr:HTH domain-containing protein [Oribacterium sinus]
MGGGNVSRNVSQDVSRMSLEEIENIIKDMIKEDNKVSRKDIAMILGVSEKAITRYIKEIPNIKYVGKGKNGHWELND